MHVSFVEGEMSDTCAAGVATQSVDDLALVMRFCVQLLFRRGSTTPSFCKPMKNSSVSFCMREETVSVHLLV